MDSCTQVNKTILELANLESCSLSSDSLSQSSHGEKNSSNIHIEGVDLNSNYNSERLMCNKAPLTYSRRNTINLYFNGNECDNNQVPTGANKSVPVSLTRTFLQKKEKERNALEMPSRSLFLQQTSPFHKLSKEFKEITNANCGDQFKSHSCIEYSDSFIHNKIFSEKPQLPLTRFTVKNIKDQLPVDNIQPLKRFCSVSQPSQKNEHISSEEEDESTNNYTNILHSNRSKCMNMPNASNTIDKNNIQYLKHPGKSPCSDINSIGASKIVKEANKNSYRKRDSSAGICSSATTHPLDENLLQTDFQNLNINSLEELTSTSQDNLISTTLNQIRSSNWSVALKGLQEMTELCRTMDPDLIYPHMTIVNQRLLELLRSPRSHVCRTACQVAGHLFEYIKDTRRPEFDDIIEVLLCKTADANKFIRKDSNLSLDSIITHIPILHSVRALCLKGPTHKNPLVRTATIRLIICAVVITGPEVVLNAQNLESTRKRIIQNLAHFLNDKDQETRKLAERLFKILHKENAFEQCLKRFLEKDEINRMKGILKRKNEKRH